MRLRCAWSPRTRGTWLRRGRSVRELCTHMRSSVLGDRRRVQMLLLVGYNGDAFHGSQWQNSVRTVEGELMASVQQAGLVLDTNADRRKRMRLSSGSRTDAGAHALGALFSARMVVPVGQLEKEPSGAFVADLLKPHLPSDLWVIATRKGPKRFQAQTRVNSRTYEYLMPYELVRGTPWEDTQRLNDLLAGFVGSHHMHNYASQLPSCYQGDGEGTLESRLSYYGLPEHCGDFLSEERRHEVATFRAIDVAYRTVFACEAAPRVLHLRQGEGGDGPLIDVTSPVSAYQEGGAPRWTSFVPIRIRASSFLYHQIRRMMAAVAMVCVGAVPASLIPTSLHAPFRFRLPLMPSNGLLLTASSVRTDDHPSLNVYKWFELDEREAERRSAAEDSVRHASMRAMQAEMTQAWPHMETSWPDMLCGDEAQVCDWSSKWWLEAYARTRQRKRDERHHSHARARGNVL